MTDISLFPSSAFTAFLLTAFGLGWILAGIKSITGFFGTGKYSSWYLWTVVMIGVTLQAGINLDMTILVPGAIAFLAGARTPPAGQ